MDGRVLLARLDAVAEGERADLEAVAVLEIPAHHRAAVHAYAVGAAEVPDPEAAAGDLERGVLARDRFVVEHHVHALAASEREAVLLERDLGAAQRARGKDDGGVVGGEEAVSAALLVYSESAGPSVLHDTSPSRARNSRGGTSVE